VTPVGIDGRFFSWDDASVRSIVDRNRHADLSPEDFILPGVPADELPYPLCGVSMLGPLSLARGAIGHQAIK